VAIQPMMAAITMAPTDVAAMADLLMPRATPLVMFIIESVCDSRLQTVCLLINASV
jgi:hypothetical protein